MAVNLEDFEKLMGKEWPDDMIKPTLFLTMYKLQWELMRALWEFIDKKKLTDETYEFFAKENENMIQFNMTLTAVFCRLLAKYDAEKMPAKILLQMYFDMLNAEITAMKEKRGGEVLH